MEIEPGNWRLDVFLLFIQTWCIKITKKKKPTSSIYEEVSVFSLHVKSLRAWLKEGMIRRRLEGKVLHASLSHVALWCHDTHPTPSQIPSAPSKTIQKYKFPMHGRQRAQWAFVQRPWSRGWFFFFFFFLRRCLKLSLSEWKVHMTTGLQVPNEKPPQTV